MIEIQISQLLLHLPFFFLQWFSAYMVFTKILGAILNKRNLHTTIPSYHYLVLPSLGVLSLEITFLATLKILNFNGLILMVITNLIVSKSRLMQFAIHVASNGTTLLKRNLAKPGFWVISLILLVHSTLLPLPDRNVDVAVFHFPLLSSLLSNDGFKFPQISHPFYGSIPLGSHLLAAGFCVETPNPLALHLMNYIILWSLILMVSRFIGKSFASNFVIFSSLVFGFSNYFLFPSTDGMQDVLRSSVSLAAILLFYKYLISEQESFLLLSGVTVGFAASLKMSELLVFLWIFIMVFLCKTFSKVWRDRTNIILLFFLPSVIFGGYFYFRNIVFTGNPLYPFLFSHPGLSDEWMQNYYRVLSIPDDPNLLHFRREVLNPWSYLDFIIAYCHFFLNSKFLVILHSAIVVGLFRMKELRSLFTLNVFMFIFWYFFMFNNNRWALTAHLFTIFIASMSFVNEMSFLKKYITNLTNLKFRIAVSFFLVFSIFLQVTPFSKIDIFKKLDPLKSYLYENAKQKEVISLGEIGNDSRLYKFIEKRKVMKVYYSNQMSPNEFYFLYTLNPDHVFEKIPSELEFLPNEFYFLGNPKEKFDSILSDLEITWHVDTLANNLVTKTEFSKFTKF